MLDTITQAVAREGVSHAACANRDCKRSSDPVGEPQPQPFTGSERDTIRKLHLNRASLSIMAAEIKRPKDEVKALMAELGLGIRGGIWSPLHDERLRELCKRGDTVAQIAEEMCFTAETIRAHLRALGLPYNHGPNPRQFWTDARVEQVRQMAARGDDDKDIAKFFKKKVKQIVLVRNEHRIKLNREVALASWREKVCSLSPEKQERLRRMAASGADDKAISEELHLSVKKVKSLRRRLKVRTKKDRPWSTDELEILCSRWPTSAGLSIICAEVNHTAYFLSKKATELNLPPRPNTRRTNTST